MKNTRFLAAAVAALLCANVFAGCSSSDSSGEQSSAESTESTADTDSPDNSEGDTAPVEFTELEAGSLTVSADVQSGFYDREFELSLTASDPAAEIYYTTDGSEPTPASLKYSDPIHISDRSWEENVLASHRSVSAGGDYVPSYRLPKGTVIRAAAFKDGTKRGDVLTGSYFVNIDREADYLDVPIISIAIDEDSLFDYDTGIYTLGKAHDDWLKEDKKNASLDGWQHEANYTQRGREWEREASVEYICADGSIAFAQDMGVRIMGAASRNEMQKSLRLTAREEYGKKNVKFEVIPDNERSDGKGNVDKYKSFVLRNGGNDCNFAKIRDPLLQSLVWDRDFETLQSTPCVAFINGEYWGMYTITEDYSDNYFRNNYEIEKENVVLIKRGELEEGLEGDLDLYTDMISFITENDMSDPENYKQACELMDMQSFADYCAFNLYIFNEDSIFKDNNWRMWRTRNPVEGVPEGDGRWRMAVYDVDYSTGIYRGGDGYKEANVSSAIKGTGAKDGTPAKAFASLCENEEFLEMFTTAIFDLRNVNFEKERARDAADAMGLYYKKLVPDTYGRFGPQYVLGEGYTQQKIGELKSFLGGRYDFFAYTVPSTVGVGEKHILTLDIENRDKGEVKINNSKSPLWNGFEGIYPEICEVTLRAEAKDGSTFKGWEAEGIELPDPTAETISFKMGADVNLKAVFE
ncbi:MAG: CotH kinase family protein [Ruminococcus sp.]|nr:CotH kinase family protein [Ruminococcus sp.]MBR1764735.1 CotH kinase family protein [Ruminococcus sp.]